MDAGRQLTACEYDARQLTAREYNAGNSQRVSTTPGNSQRVSTTTAPDPMAMPIYMNGSLRLNKALYGLKQAIS